MLCGGSYLVQLAVHQPREFYELRKHANAIQTYFQCVRARPQREWRRIVNVQ